MLSYRSKHHKPTFLYPTPYSCFLPLAQPLMHVAVLLGRSRVLERGPGAVRLLEPCSWYRHGGGGCGRAVAKPCSPRRQPLPRCWGRCCWGDSLGWGHCWVGGCGVCWDTRGKQGPSAEELGSELCHPLHSVQHSLLLFISFLLGMWNRESTWKQLDSHQMDVPFCLFLGLHSEIMW